MQRTCHSHSFLGRILGTPNEEIWPTVSTLPDYKASFPQWSSQDLGRIVTRLNEAGMDLLKVCHALVWFVPDRADVKNFSVH